MSADNPAVEDDVENREEVNLDTSTGETSSKKLARSERKRKHYEELLVKRKENRKQKKLDRKLRLQQDGAEAKETGDEAREATDRLSKRERKEGIKLRLEEALRTGQRICVDCSLQEFMSDKEIGKLAMQIGRLYGSNRKADNPAHLYLTGLKREGTLYQECVKKNDGFQNYLIDLQEKSHTELFPLDKIVYLSPDSDNALSALDSDCVYVMGGLVDESVTKNISQSKAVEAGIQTARLPIDEYMDKIEQSSYSKVLSVNQVFDILLTYLSTGSWRAALQAGVPKRKGYVLKPNPPVTDTSTDIHKHYQSEITGT